MWVAYGDKPKWENLWVLIYTKAHATEVPSNPKQNGLTCPCVYHFNAGPMVILTVYVNTVARTEHMHGPNNMDLT